MNVIRRAVLITLFIVSLGSLPTIALELGGQINEVYPDSQLIVINGTEYRFISTHPSELSVLIKGQPVDAYALREGMNVRFTLAGTEGDAATTIKRIEVFGPDHLINNLFNQ